MMSMEQHSWKYLAPKPGSLYRQLFVDGTRIAARILYGLYTPGEDCPGRSVEEIASDFNLPIEAVREAIAYCESDPPEIRQDWEEEEEIAKAYRDKSASGKTALSLQTVAHASGSD